MDKATETVQKAKDTASTISNTAQAVKEDTSKVADKVKGTTARYWYLVSRKLCNR